MRIALISFEFPPSVAVGGIGAYAWQAAKMLACSGNEVEVFAAGNNGLEPAAEFGVTVHRFDVKKREEFCRAILPAFTSRHLSCPFDVLESPEIGAEGVAVAQEHPEIACVVKLHTPSFLVEEASFAPASLLDQLRFLLGSIRRGRWATLPRRFVYDREGDEEFHFCIQADEIAAPSQAIADRLIVAWSLPRDKVSVFPLPFNPAPALLALPLPKRARTIGFLGRLEARKGIVEFAQAIPMILAKFPQTRFRFLGPSWPYGKTDMEKWISKKIPDYLPAIDFVGEVSRKDLVSELARCDVICLPSRWENFPFACWESMASGRAVIGSASGGMADVIQTGVSGLLVEPHSPQDIAEKILSLVDQVTEVTRLGANARVRVEDRLSVERVLPLQIASYNRAIESRRTMIGLSKGKEIL